MSILKEEQTDYFWWIYLSGGVYDGANSTENHFGSSNGGRSLIGRIGAAENLQRRKSRHPLPKQERKKYFV